MNNQREAKVKRVFVWSIATCGLLISSNSMAQAPLKQWTANYQTCSKSNYYYDQTDKCWDRRAGGILLNCQPYATNARGATRGAGAPVPYVTATPAQVNSQIVCDIAEESKRQKATKRVSIFLRPSYHWTFHFHLSQKTVMVSI
jgi:hypothetical protein